MGGRNLAGREGVESCYDLCIIDYPNLDYLIEGIKFRSNKEEDAKTYKSRIPIFPGNKKFYQSMSHVYPVVT